MRGLAPIILLLLLAACGRGEVVQPVSPTVFVPPRAATATAEAREAAEATTQVPSQAVTEADTVTISGDAALGQALFDEFQAEASFACATCHLADSEAQLIGPGLQGVSQRAATRVEGQSAPEYIQNSIRTPDAFVVPGFPDNLMPRVYGDIFTDEQIDNLIAYLMTL
jgi:mono/diheme cytochrome c family protein